MGEGGNNGRHYGNHWQTIAQPHSANCVPRTKNIEPSPPLPLSLTLSLFSPPAPLDLTLLCAGVVPVHCTEAECGPLYPRTKFPSENLSGPIHHRTKATGAPAHRPPRPSGPWAPWPLGLASPRFSRVPAAGPRSARGAGALLPRPPGPPAPGPRAPRPVGPTGPGRQGPRATGPAWPGHHPPEFKKYMGHWFKKCLKQNFKSTRPPYIV